MYTRKSLALTYVIWFFGGMLGLHRFYLGYKHTGLMMLFTGGGGGLWWIIDAFYLPVLHSGVNRGYAGRIPHWNDYYYRKAAKRW